MKIRICSNLGGRDRAGDLNSLECERKRSHGRNSAGYSAAGGRADAGD